jgi:haloalkane dehalogenase
MEQGAGAPCVLLHGNPTWGFLWRKVALALRGAGLRLVMPDLPGLGLSEKPRDPGFHSLASHARVFGDLLDALAPERLVLVLHDWGGPIGLAALAERPGRLAGLVVTNTGVRPPSPTERPTRFLRFANLPVISDVAFRLGGFPQNALHLAQADRRSISGAVARAYRWPLRRLRDRVAPLALARMVPLAPGHPSLPLLERTLAFARGYDGPAAIVWGEQDPILGRALRGVADALPHATITRVQAGHYPQEETPVPIAAAILEVARSAGLVG